MVTGKLQLLPLATLQTLLPQYIAAVTAVAVGNQSYSIAGRQFTRANLTELTDALAEIQYAISIQTGDAQKFTYADVSCG